MKNASIIYLNIILILLVGIASFYLGRSTINNNFTEQTSLKNTFVGRVYEISYPWNWTFEGPSEGPITGFPEFSKLVSPSGDSQIVIGLKGDNRFEYVYDDIRQKTESTQLLVGNKTYAAEEQYLDINEDPEFNIVLLETEINDKRLIGFTIGAREISLPMKIQILYRFTSENIPYEEKLKMYQKEKEEALKILQTFKLKTDIQ